MLLSVCGALALLDLVSVVRLRAMMLGSVKTAEPWEQAAP